MIPGQKDVQGLLAAQSVSQSVHSQSTVLEGAAQPLAGMSTAPETIHQPSCVPSAALYCTGQIAWTQSLKRMQLAQNSAIPIKLHNVAALALDMPHIHVA